MAYQSLTDKNTPVKPVVSTPPLPTNDTQGVATPAKQPAYVSLSAPKYQSLSDQGKTPGQISNPPASLPTPAQPFDNTGAGIALNTVKGLPKAAGNIAKSVVGKVYDVATGLLLPTATPEETHNASFLFDVAKGIPGAVYDDAKQVVTHPFTSSQDFVGGLARGIANSVTDIMVNAVPEKDREATRTEVQATLDKYLTPPSSGKETPGGFIAGGAEVGGSSAPFIAAGAGGKALGLKTGIRGAATAGEVAGFVGAGQATIAPEATPQERLDQALNDVLALGIFKVGSLAYAKAKSTITKAKVNAPEVLMRAQKAYETLPPEIQKSGEVPNPVAKPIETAPIAEIKPAEVAPTPETPKQYVPLSNKQTVTPEHIATHEQALRDTYKAQGQSTTLPEFSKADEHLSDITNEMQLSKAGERVFVPDAKSSGYDVHAVPSTFPDWVPENLRLTSLFDKVIKPLQSLETLKYPEGNRPKQRALVDAILNELDTRLGVDTSAQRNAIINAHDTITEQRKLAKAGSGSTTGGAEYRTGGPTEKVTSLATEARKYKTAEDFVVAQIGNFGNVAKYTKPISKSTEKITVYRGMPEGEVLPRYGDYVTTDIEYAKNFGPNVVKMDIPKNQLHQGPREGSQLLYVPKELTHSQLTDIWNKAQDNKTVDISNPKNFTTSEDFVRAHTPIFRGIETAPASNRIKEGATPEYTGTAFSRSKEQAQNYGDMVLHKYISENKILNPKDISPIALKELRDVFNKLDVNDADTIPLEKLISKVMNIAKQSGKDAADIAAFFPKMKEEAEIRILGKAGDVLTKSQLTELWKKAHETTQKVEPSKKVSSDKGNDFFSAKDLKNPLSETVTKKTDNVTKQSVIAKELASKLDTEIRQGKFRKSGAIGVYKHAGELVRYKSGGLNTIFHEVFHHLDKRFDFSAEFKNFKSEIDPLLSEYHNPPKDPVKRMREAYAEFGRYYLTGQLTHLKEVAPEFSKYFEERIAMMPDIKNVLDTAAQDYKRWQEQPAVAKVFAQISVSGEGKGPLKDRIANGLHDLYTQAIDDLHPLSEYSKIAREVNPGLKAENDPYILARNLRGWVGRADTFLRRGTFGKDFYKVGDDGKVKPNYTGKSFESIMRPIEEKGQMDALRTYLVARRAIELNKRGMKTGIEMKDAKAALEELSKEHAHFDDVAKDLYKYQDATLEYVRSSGLIDKTTFEKMQELNKDYVPFFRVFDEMKVSGFMGGKKIGSTKSPVKSIRGSEREIVDPLESIVKNTYALINAADRNAVAVAMARLSSTDYRLGRLVENVPQGMSATKVSVDEVLKKALGPAYDYIAGAEGGGALTEQMVNIFRPSFSTKPGEISVMMDGKFKVFEVETDLYRAIQGLDKEDVATFVKILSYPASWLRAGATLTPDFAIRNPVRDQFSAYVYSKGGYLPGVDMMRGMFELFKQGDAYQLWKMSGGESATMVSIDREGMQKNLKEILQSRGAEGLSYVKNPLKLLQEFSQTFEVATRLGEMKKVLEKTGNPTEAAFASREVTLDFNRIGAKTKAINMLTAFWNANVQGTDKFIRQVKANPRATMAKTFMAITMPSILLYYANRNDPRWKEIPQWQKDLFWIVFTDDHIIRIPKPFELGILFGSVPERALEYMDTHNPDIFKELESAVASGVTPGFIPTGIVPIIENISNYSFFTDRPIVPNGKEGLPNAFQSSTYTSEVAKVVGEAFNYSPAKIDNLIHGYTGGLGVYASNMIDSLLLNSGARYKAPAPTKTLEDIPGIKAFLVRNPVGSGSESVNSFYNAYQEAQAGMLYVKKEAEVDPEKAKKYILDHPDAMYASELGNVANIFSALNKVRDEIMNSKTLSPVEKKARLVKIDTSMTEIASKAMKMVNNKKTSANGQ